MKSIYEVMVDTYGRDAQMDMVIEECSELTKAILKLRRAEHHNSRARRDMVNRETKEGQLIIKAMEGSVLKRQEELVEEWADVSIMLEQLKVMVPGKYQYALEDKIKVAVNKLSSVGLILGEDFEVVI
jgi:NTP pyrophosphatase (non-canonical NTP hydrolase)